MHKQTTIQKLHKTADSLVAHVSRGNTIQGRRSLELVDRYNDLRSAATSAEWETFCNSRGYATEGDGYDFFA